MLKDVRSKLESLPKEAHIRNAIKLENIKSLFEQIESKQADELEWHKWPPLFLFLYRHSISEVFALESDIALVFRHSSRKNQKNILDGLQAQSSKKRWEGKWAGSLFEIFAKSLCLKERGLAVGLDYLLPNSSDTDIRMEMEGKRFHLECTVLTDSDEDREVWERFIEAKKADPEICLTRPGPFDPLKPKGPSPYYDCLRVYDKVYDKIAKELDLNKSQLSEDAPNILLISFFSPYRHLSPTSPGVGWALDELFADQPKICADHPSFRNISLIAWLTFTEKRLRQSGVTLNPANDSQWFNKVIASPRKIGAVLLFDRFLLKASRVNYNAKQECRISHHEMAKFEELFSFPPEWESGTL